MGFVYRILNTETNKEYIGSTLNYIKERKLIFLILKIINTIVFIYNDHITSMVEINLYLKYYMKVMIIKRLNII